MGAVDSVVVDPITASGNLPAGSCNLADMRAANPGVKFYAYLDIGGMSNASSWTRDPFHSTCVSLNRDGASHTVKPNNGRVAVDCSGNAVYPGFSFLRMGSLSSAYNVSCADRAADIVTTDSACGTTGAAPTQFDGVLLDDMTMSPAQGQNMRDSGLPEPAGAGAAPGPVSGPELDLPRVHDRRLERRATGALVRDPAERGTDEPSGRCRHPADVPGNPAATCRRRSPNWKGLYAVGDTQFAYDRHVHSRKLNDGRWVRINFLKLRRHGQWALHPAAHRCADALSRVVRPRPEPAFWRQIPVLGIELGAQGRDLLLFGNCSGFAAGLQAAVLRSQPPVSRCLVKSRGDGRRAEGTASALEWKCLVSGKLESLDLQLRLPHDGDVVVRRGAAGMPSVVVASPALADGRQLVGHIQAEARGGVQPPELGYFLGISVPADDENFPEPSTELGARKLPLAERYLPDDLQWLAKGYTDGWGLGIRSQKRALERAAELAAPFVRLLSEWYRVETVQVG